MPDSWMPGTYYGFGSVVEYEGACYKIIQPHTSQGDWTPSITPALWGRIPDDVQQHHEWEPPREPQQPPEKFHYGGDDHQQGFPEQKPFQEHPDQTVNVEHEEKKKNWYDLDDKRKQELEVGGGLLAGLAVIGAGYYAYHHHEESEEKKKAMAWGIQNWLREAQERTDEFTRNGPSAPTTWVLTEGNSIPQGALVGGHHDGKPLYIARGFCENSIQVGKAGPGCPKGCAVGYGHKQYDLPKYEVLLGDPRAIQWVQHSGRLNLVNLGARPVEGGHEPDGTPLYIAQGEYHGHLVVGKCSEKLDEAFVVWDGKEREVKHYRVLCYH